jgi:hypothetical protein
LPAGASAEPGAPPATSPVATRVITPDQQTAKPADDRPPPDLERALLRPSNLRDRQQQFADAVAAISSELGKPISARRALEDMPCGGWSGPDCSNLTFGLEIAKTCAPIIASFHRKRTAEVMVVLAEAISIHSVWHDAFGYIHRKLGTGPGYTYAGCLFSKCDAGNFKNGQVDGLLYQVGRLLGLLSGPPCGPSCALATPGASGPTPRSTAGAPTPQ